MADSEGEQGGGLPISAVSTEPESACNSVAYSNDTRMERRGLSGRQRTRQRFAWESVCKMAGSRCELRGALRPEPGEDQQLQAVYDQRQYPCVFPPSRDDYVSWTAVAEVDSSLMPCTEREVCFVANGVPARLVRRRRVAILKGLGNAVVPQVAYAVIKTALEAFLGDEV